MCTWTTLWLFSLFKKKSAICSCWLYMLGYLSSGLMPFQCRQLLKNKWQMLVTWPPEGRRSLSKMSFQPQMLKKNKTKTQQLHIALSKEQLLVFAAWQWQEKAQSYLCCAPWLIPMWYPDCIMKLDGENAQMLLWVTLPAVGRKAHCLNCASMCFVCVWVCAGGGGRARAAEGAYWFQCAVACVARTGGLHLSMKCVGGSVQVHFGRRTTCVTTDVCVYRSPHMCAALGWVCNLHL